MRTYKGFMGDSVFSLIYMFAICVVFVVLAYAASQISFGSSTPDAIINGGHTAFTNFNSVAPLFIIGLAVALNLSAFLIRSFPLMYIFFFIIQGIVAYISLFLTNSYFSLFTNSPLSGEAGNFGLWTLLFQYLPFISLLLSIIFAVSIYGKGD